MSLFAFPHVLEFSGRPPPPNPILESQVVQAFSLLGTTPILATGVAAHCIEAFFITVRLERSLGSNQRLPCVSTQWSGAITTVSDQWIQRVSLLVDNDEVYVSSSFHTETDLSEGYVPVCRHLCLQRVKSCRSSWRIVRICISPVDWVVVEGALIITKIFKTTLRYQVDKIF